jgi:lysozyme
MTPENRALLAKELERDEGLVLHAYEDSLGFLTLGVGRLIDKRRGGGITKEEAHYLLGNDIAEVETGLDMNLPWWRGLSPVRQRVLVSMGFNLGMGGLLKFHNTLAAMDEGDFKTAARGMRQSLWRKQTGERAERLAKMMEEG